MTLWNLVALPKTVTLMFANFKLKPFVMRTCRIRTRQIRTCQTDELIKLQTRQTMNPTNYEFGKLQTTSNYELVELQTTSALNYKQT